MTAWSHSSMASSGGRRVAKGSFLTTFLSLLPKTTGLASGLLAIAWLVFFLWMRPLSVPVDKGVSEEIVRSQMTTETLKVQLKDGSSSVRSSSEATVVTTSKE